MTFQNEGIAGLAGIRVLVVEDEPLTALDIQEIFAASGAEVFGLSHATEGPAE